MPLHSEGLVLSCRCSTRADGAAMKIALLAPFAIQPKGTARVRVMPLARALARRGHAVTVLIPPYDHPQDSGDQWEDQGVRVRNLPVGSNPSSASLALLGLALARAARRTTPDVIHVFKPKGVTGIAQLALWALRQERVVLDIDDWEGRGGWNERGAVFGPQPALVCLARTVGHPARQRTDCGKPNAHRPSA